MQRAPRYNLYFVPAYPLEKLTAHDEQGLRDGELAIFLDTITEHIRRYGLKNPPTAHRRMGRIEIRPGKCRVTAYRRLGKKHIPLVLADFDRGAPEPDWEPLPHDPERLQSRFYSLDCVVEMNDRFFAVKKSDGIVHRPSQIDRFAADLAADPQPPEE